MTDVKHSAPVSRLEPSMEYLTRWLEHCQLPAAGDSGGGGADAAEDCAAERGNVTAWTAVLSPTTDCNIERSRGEWRQTVVGPAPVLFKSEQSRVI